MNIAVFSLDFPAYPCAQIRLIRPFSYLYPEIKYKWCVQSDGQRYQISFEALGWADIIIVQRFFLLRDFRPYLEKIFSLNKPVICELDDLLWQVPSSNFHLSNLMKINRPYILKILPCFTGVTVSTQELAREVSQYNKDVFVLPNLLDKRLWDRPLAEKSEHREYSGGGKRIKICFAGSPTHQGDLEMIEQPLLDVLERFIGDVELVLFGCATKRLMQFSSVKFFSFDDGYARFVKTLFSLHLDIGLAPLEDNGFNRCKSNIKWLEYSACAAAGIYSDLPPYKDVQSGRDGLLVGNSQKEWREALEFLICNKKERIKMGYMARKRVMDEFTLNKNRAEVIKEYYLRCSKS
ncbi:glycosyltransferase family protein [Desulfovulcanus sp.]